MHLWVSQYDPFPCASPHVQLSLCHLWLIRNVPWSHRLMFNQSTRKEEERAEDSNWPGSFLTKASHLMHWAFTHSQLFFYAPSCESLVNFTRCHAAKKIGSIFSSENAPALWLTMFYISKICYSSAATLWASTWATKSTPHSAVMPS